MTKNLTDERKAAMGGGPPGGFADEGGKPKAIVLSIQEQNNEEASRTKIRIRRSPDGRLPNEVELRQIVLDKLKLTGGSGDHGPGAGDGWALRNAVTGVPIPSGAEDILEYIRPEGDTVEVFRERSRAGRDQGQGEAGVR